MLRKALRACASFLAASLATAILVVLLCGIVLAIKKASYSKKIRTFVAEIVKEELQFNSKAEVLVGLLKISTAYDNNQAINLLRLGRENDGGYVVPEKAIKAADVLLGYGIATDQSFEEDFSSKYNKKSYGFDCGISSLPSSAKLFTFVNECIGTDQFLYNRGSSSKKVTSFSTQLKNLSLIDKKVFIKMDIEGAEYEAFEDIYKHHSNITGVVIEIHFHNAESIDKAISLLRELNKNFVLVHVHGNNSSRDASFMTSNSSGRIPNILELSYIHKSLITSHIVSKNQKHPTELDMSNIVGKDDMKFEM